MFLIPSRVLLPSNMIKAPYTAHLVQDSNSHPQNRQVYQRFPRRRKG